jgi:hypothetical protein
MALGATFANQSLFLSKTDNVEGETVLVYAVVSNDTAEGFSGSLTIEEGDRTVGSANVSLTAGEARAISISWTPSAGRHTLTATLLAGDGTKVSEESALFNVEKKPEPQQEGAVAFDTASEVESSQEIQEKIAEYVPAVAGASTPLFSTVDSLRISGAQALESGAQWARAQSKESDTPGLMGSVGRMLSTLLGYVFALFLYIVKNAALFYPIFAIAILYGFWKLYKNMRTRG